MIPLFLVGAILLLGLSIAQVLSTVQVYLSNLDYYKFLSSVQAAGYLAVPNEIVFSTLKDFGPAFCGGLFFTFTAGAGLTLIAAGAAWAWDRLFARGKTALSLFCLLLLLSLVGANSRGLSPLLSAYLLCIPAAVFFFTLKWLPERPRDERSVDMALPLLAFLVCCVLVLAWRPSLVNEDRFLDVRDSLLLSNPLGRKLNAFYYENSLYATRVFNFPRQQLIKSCRIVGSSDSSLRKRITEALLSRDYLPFRNPVRPDVSILQSDKDLEFYDGDKRVLKTSVADFLLDPAKTLKQVETITNRQSFLLGFFTLFSILFVGALLLYACVYVPAYWLSGLFLRSTPKAIKAAILWPVILLAVFLALRVLPSEEPGNPVQLSRALASEHLHSRMAALRYIARNGIDIARFPSYQKRVHSPHIAERYWVAKALGISRTPETLRSLRQLLADPHFNVVCMALDSLGRRGGRGDIPLLLDKLKTSANGYVQGYAYRALRRLGWKQTEPAENSRVGDPFGQ